MVSSQLIHRDLCVFDVWDQQLCSLTLYESEMDCPKLLRLHRRVHINLTSVRETESKKGWIRDEYEK